MKKLFRIFGIIAFIALIGFSMVSCNNEVIVYRPSTPIYASPTPFASTRLPVNIDEDLEAAIDKAVAPFVQLHYTLTVGTTTYPSVPGAVILVVKNGEIVAEKAYGFSYLTDAPDTVNLAAGADAVNKARNSAAQARILQGTMVANPVRMRTDTLFDLASITKIMATTQAIMKLVSDGDLALTDLVKDHIPEFTSERKDTITVGHLLMHSSGLSQWEPDYLLPELWKDRAAVLNFYNTMPIDTRAPGSLYSYSDIGFRLLAYIVEAVSGKSFDQFCKEEIYQPLGLRHTTFNPLQNGFRMEHTAATSWGNYYEMAMVDGVNLLGFGYNTNAGSISGTAADGEYTQMYLDGLAALDAKTIAGGDGWRTYTLRGEVNDGNTWMGGAGISGAAGLFSTASDLAVLGQMMLNGGIYDGVRIYDEAVLTTFRGQGYNAANGYGFKRNNSFMGAADTRTANHTFGHDGFTGTQVWMDVETKMVFVVLTNKMNVGAHISVSGSQYRPNYSNTLGQISPSVGNAVYAYYGGRQAVIDSLQE